MLVHFLFAILKLNALNMLLYHQCSQQKFKIYIHQLKQGERVKQLLICKLLTDVKGNLNHITGEPTESLT